MRYEHLVIFCSVAVAAWFLVIYFWPHLLLNVYKRALLTKGFEGPISINTLATEPQAIFADPLHPPASATKLATTGVNHDTLLTAGVLNLRDGPQVLHVPDMAGRAPIGRVDRNCSKPLPRTSCAMASPACRCARWLPPSAPAPASSCITSERRNSSSSRQWA